MAGIVSSSASFPDAPRRVRYGAAESAAEPAVLPDASDSSDNALLAALQRDLGDEVFLDLVTGLSEEMARRLCSVQQEPWDWHSIRNDARAMLSLAASFGFSALAASSRAILSVCEHPPRRAADVLRPYLAEVHRLRSTIADVSRTIGMAGGEGGGTNVVARSVRDGAS